MDEAESTLSLLMVVMYIKDKHIIQVPSQRLFVLNVRHIYT